MTETRTPEPTTGKPRGIDLPFRRSMPAPLLIAFVVVAVAALATVVYLVASPPSPRIAVGARRSPPSPILTHDVGAIALAAILGNEIAATTPPCDAVRGVVVEGGEPAVARVTQAIRRLCPLADSLGDVADAVRALSSAHIRFATFARTGDASTAQLAARRILVNISFARSGSPVLPIAPLLVHEGYHLAHASEPRDARQELAARKAELQTCRLVIDVRAWSRGCTDAESLLRAGDEAAIVELVKAGFAR